MKRWMFSGMILFLSLLVGCDDRSADALVVTQSQDGETVELAKGETLTVELAGNPTTGYEWTIARIDAAFLRLADSSYSPDSSAIGSGGRYAFRFEALNAGATSLGLVYRRSWEPSDADPTFTLAVNIQGGTDDPAAASLNGTTWRLVGWSASSLDPADFNITAAFADGQISGRSAVNSYGGPCSVSPSGAFSIGALTMTEMAGDENSMRAESLYHNLLAQARRHRIVQNQLVLANADGQDLLIFDSSD